MSNEYTIHLKIEHLPEGEYLATCKDLPGLVAQGRTVSETVEIAQDVSRKLIESYVEHGDKFLEEWNVERAGKLGKIGFPGDYGMI